MAKISVSLGVKSPEITDVFFEAFGACVTPVLERLDRGDVAEGLPALGQIPSREPQGLDLTANSGRFCADGSPWGAFSHDWGRWD